MTKKSTLHEVIAQARAEIEQWPPHMREMLERRREFQRRVDEQQTAAHRAVDRDSDVG